MKKLFLSLFLVTATLCAMAQDMSVASQTSAVSKQQVQTFRFGYLSYQTALQSMPGYALARRNLEDLRIKYDAEMKRVEEEFNKKYEDFLEEQRDFAPSIRQKRQAELQELMEKNIAFKKEAQRLLAKAETEAYDPLREKLANAILVVGKEKGLAFILNTDNNAVPYINVEMGENVAEAVSAAMR